MPPKGEEPERRGEDSHFKPFGQPFDHEKPAEKDMGEEKNQPHPHGFRPPRGFGNDFDDEDDDDDDDDEEFEMTGTPYNQQLHYGGHHGSHHGGHKGHHGKHQDHEGGHEMSKSHHKTPEVDPYKKWLDSLPYMSKEESKMQAKQFWTSIIIFSGIWGTIFFALQQACFFYCIK